MNKEEFMEKTGEMKIAFLVEENGLLLATDLDGDKVLYTKDLEYSTFWFDSYKFVKGYIEIIASNIYRKQKVIYTEDLQYFTEWITTNGEWKIKDGKNEDKKIIIERTLSLAKNI